jgi:hypothetical protein
LKPYFFSSKRHEIIEALVGNGFLKIISAKPLMETEIAQVCSRIADARND